MNLFGVFGALLIGIVLGLIGGGGSILTVPIFVYVLDVEPVLATAYSLFVVGIAALFGAIKNAQENLVEYKTGFVFAIPAFIGVYIARRFLLDFIPNIIFKLGEFSLTKDMGIMMFFALIMILASYFMIKDKNEQNINKKSSHNIYILISRFYCRYFNWNSWGRGWIYYHSSISFICWVANEKCNWNIFDDYCH